MATARRSICYDRRSRCGGKDQLGRGSRSSHPGLLPEARSGLTEVCVEAVFKARSNLLGPTSAEEVILGYKRVQGGFKGTSVSKEVTIGGECT